MTVDILVFILSPTANGGCEILTLSKADRHFTIPVIEANENLQSEALKYSQKLLDVQNVELLSYLGCKENVHAYILRTIQAQVKPEQLARVSCQFTILRPGLSNDVQVEAQAFWKLLTSYTQEYMVW